MSAPGDQGESRRGPRALVRRAARRLRRRPLGVVAAPRGEGELGELMGEVRRVDVISQRLVDGVLAGHYRSVFRGSGVEFDEIREYVPGDDPRAVDGHVTARMGRPFVKTFVDERELSVFTLLDVSASMTGGFGVHAARRTAVQVAACLALSAVRNHDKVGLLAFSDRVEHVVKPRGGHAQVLRLVRDALALPPVSRGSDLRPALRRLQHLARRRAVVFVVSDFLHDGWQERLAPVARRHDVIAVRLLMPELSAPDAGLMHLRDPEGGATCLVDWRHPRVRSAFGSGVAAWHERTRRGLARAGVDLLDVQVPRLPDPGAVARSLLRFFRMRERRGAKR